MLSADLGVQPELWVRLWLRLDAGGANQFDVDEVTFFGVGSDPRADDPRVAVGVRGTQGISPCLAVRQYMASYLIPAYYDDVAVTTQRIGCN